MATIVLGTLGSMIGGPVGGLLGSTLGGYIDRWAFGSLTPPIKGPRLSEIRLPSFDEGAPAPWLQGPQSRVACQVIWMGSKTGPERVEERKNTSGGGKGGGKPKTVTYDYYVSLAIAVARQSLTPTADADGKFRPVRKLWANGTLIYDADKAASVTSSNVKVIKNTKNKTFSSSCSNKAYQEEIVYEHQSSATFFQDAGFQANAVKVVVTGFANAANNGTYTITKIETVSSKSRLTVLRCEHDYKAGGTFWAPTCTDTSTCTAAVNENAGASVSFVQQMDKHDKALIEDVRQYCGGKDQDGTSPQTADSTLTAVEGTGNVPAFRNTAYVVLKNLKITNWGGSVPSFEALVQENGTRTVADAIVNLATRNGSLTSDDIDVTAVTGNVLGLVVMGMKDPKTILQMLLSVYDLEVQEYPVVEGGVFKVKLRFFPKASADLVSIADGDRGARTVDSGSEDGMDLIGVEQTDPDLLPGSVVVQYADPDEDYQPGSVTFRRVGAQTETQTQVSLPMTLSSSNALALAKKLMWQWMTNGRLKVKFTLPPTYLHVIEADRITVSDVDGLATRARVSKADRGANGLISIEALQEVESVYSEPATGESRPGT